MSATVGGGYGLSSSQLLDDQRSATSRRAALFGTIFGLHTATQSFTLRPDAVVFKNEIFERLRPLKKTVSDLVADETDYRAMLRVTKDDDAEAHAISMISAQRLAKSAHKNLDEVYRVL